MFLFDPPENVKKPKPHFFLCSKENIGKKGVHLVFVSVSFREWVTENSSRNTLIQKVHSHHMIHVINGVVMANT